MTKLLLTPEEAAETLSISRSKLYELMGAGEVESLRIGGSRRIPVDALGDFVDRQREAAHDSRPPGGLQRALDDSPVVNSHGGQS